MAFKHLRSLLSPDQGPISILKYLQQVAVLVQGNWIVSSELVYQKDTVSADSGIPAELMCRARDYVVSSYIVNFFKACHGMQLFAKFSLFLSSYFYSRRKITSTEKTFHL